MRLGSLRHSGAIIVLLLFLAAAAYGVFVTRPLPRVAPPQGARRAPSSLTVSVDETSLNTIEQLLRLPTRPEERTFAQSALRLAGQDADLAFAQAVRVAAARPRVSTPESKQIDARLAQARQALAKDSLDIARLSAAASRASAAETQSIRDRLALARAMATLDQEEVNDAQNDLARSGGDPQTRLQEMLAEHQASSKSTDSLRVVITPASDAPGLLHHLNAWQALRDKQRSLAEARAQSDSIAAALKTRHDRMEARAADRLRDSSGRQLSHDSAAALVAAAQRQALTEKSLTTLDERVDGQHHLGDVYSAWIAALDGQARTALNRLLRDTVALLFVILVTVLAARWTDRITSRLTIDRRRAQTLHMITRVALQVLGVLLMLLVIFGPPNNLGTFLGLAGAGLTVALQDFILGFIGWFVLMGRDGIRIGDLVEINGVTGEVVELGIFHTVLLETGNWSASGHPTGRRVTFANKFAIEGHYFNFSTTGQWVWDEVEILVPDGRDPYILAESLRAEAEEATAESARQAEAEWKGTRRTTHFVSLNVAPTVNLRPAPGGAAISVRYVTRMSERAEVRSRLYASAMRGLGTAAAGA
jgi:small-conductance mechanosensitive channel